jgi:hypothetical protein
VVASQESETVQVPIAQEQAPEAAKKSNEQVSWEFFIGKGYSDVQTAGILGNLKQEHGFNTSDEPSGLGIAQWLGARRERLIQRGNHLDLTTQLNFIIEELNGTESITNKLLKASYSVEESTVVFQNTYERCNPAYCMQSQRIAYAIEIYNRYK